MKQRGPGQKRPSPGLPPLSRRQVQQLKRPASKPQDAH